MKYGICIWSLPGTLEEKFALCKKVGIDGVSLSFDGAEAQDSLTKEHVRSWVSALLKQYALEFPTLGVNALCGTGMSKAENEEKVFKILEDAVEVAVSMQVKALQLPSFMDGEITCEADLVQTIKCLRFVCEKAMPYGILVGHESILSVKEIERVMKDVNCDNLFVYYDNANYPSKKGTDPIPVLEGCFKDIYQLHVKDSYANSKEPLQLGEGIGEVDHVLRVLKDRGYDGWVILESQYKLFSEYEEILEKDLGILKNAL